MTSREAAPGPPRVAVVNDFEVIVRGVHAMLRPYADRLCVVELDSDVPPSQPVDIALYDAFAMEGAQGQNLTDLVRHPHVRRLVVYTWGTDDPTMREDLLEAGVQGILPKSLPAAELVDAILTVHAGEVVVLPVAEAPADGSWPAKEEGLTERESEIVALIVEGLSNKEIASRTYLSINSVKSYIRTAYRTMEVTTRSQAILWGLDHGLRKDRCRVVVPGTAGERDETL